MSYRNLIDFFSTELSDIEFDKELESRIRNFRYSVLRKNPEIVELLSSNLTGVNTPMFSTRTVKEFFSEVLFEDRDSLQEKVYKVPGIRKDWKNTSNIYNLTIMWLMKGFLDKGNEKAAHEAYMLFGTRILVKLHEDYFKYPVKKEIAEAVVSRMSGKYLVRKLGGWGNVLQYRARDFVSRKGVNYPRITKFRTEDIITAISDGIGRIKSAILHVYSLTVEVAEKGEAIKTLSATQVSADGEETIRDITSGWSAYIDQGKTMFTDKANLKNKTYLAAVLSVTKNVKEEYVIAVLEHVANDISDPKKTKDTHKFIEDILTSTFAYLQSKGYGNVSKSNILQVLPAVANMWTVKRTENNQYKLKERMRKIVNKEVKVKTDRVKQSTTIAVLCYIFLGAVL